MLAFSYDFLVNAIYALYQYAKKKVSIIQLIYANTNNNAQLITQINPSTKELSKISNHTAIYTSHNGIHTIRAQIIKNLKSNNNSTSINLNESPILLAAIFVLFLIASKTGHHSNAIIICAYCQNIVAIITVIHRIQTINSIIILS